MHLLQNLVSPFFQVCGDQSINPHLSCFLAGMWWSSTLWRLAAGSAWGRWFRFCSRCGWCRSYCHPPYSMPWWVLSSPILHGMVSTVISHTTCSNEYCHLPYSMAWWVLSSPILHGMVNAVTSHTLCHGEYYHLPYSMPWWVLSSPILHAMVSTVISHTPCHGE